MVESKKGHNLVNVSWNSLKSLSDHLNINPKPYAKYKNPSFSGSQDIVLTRLFHCYNVRVEKGTELSQNFTEFAQKLIRSSKH